MNDGSLSRGNLDGLVLELFLDAYHGSPKAVKKMTGFVNIQENDLENNLQYRGNYSSFTISLDIQQIFHSEGTELAA